MVGTMTTHSTMPCCIAGPKSRDAKNAKIQKQTGTGGLHAGQIRGNAWRVDPPATGDDFFSGIFRADKDHSSRKAVEVKGLDFYRDPATGLFLNCDNLADMEVTDYRYPVNVFKDPTSQVNVRELPGRTVTFTNRVHLDNRKYS
jgi:hypothetical protein